MREMNLAFDNLIIAFYKMKILYENRDIIVCIKPIGVLSEESDGAESLPKMLSAYLEENVRFVNRRLKEMNSGIWTAPHEGTYLMWLDCRKWGLTERNLDLFWTEKARLWLNPGIIFGKGGAGFMRMNIASPRSILMRAMAQLEMAMNSGVS